MLESWKVAPNRDNNICDLWDYVKDIICECYTEC